MRSRQTRPRLLQAMLDAFRLAERAAGHDGYVQWRGNEELQRSRNGSLPVYNGHHYNDADDTGDSETAGAVPGRRIRTQQD